MALSNSFDFTQNRSSLIGDAFVEAGVLRPDETPGSDESEYAARSLNRMLKAFMGDGLHIFISRDATLFLEKDKTNYKLGPTGDNATESFTETAMRVAAVALATTLEVDSTTGMTAGDFIGIELDDFTSHWTTVASVTDSDTVVITTGIPSAAAIDNVIYFYTNKIQRPLNLHNVFHRNGDVDTTMFIISRSDYANLSSKSTVAQPTEIYFDKQLDNAEVNIFTSPVSVTSQVIMNLQFPFDDMDSATDNLSFPQEWLEAIHLGLAYRLASSYRSNDPKTSRLEIRSEMALEKALGFDEERADIDIYPSEQWTQEGFKGY